MFILLLLALEFFMSQPLVKAASPSTTLTWSGPTPIEQAQGNNLLSSALQASDGTLWIAWQSNRYVGTNVFYKTLKNGVWSIPVGVTGSGFDTSPALAQLKNSTIFFIWANNQTGYNHLVYVRYNNGYWSNYVTLTSAAGDDTNPSAAVAPDGTLWLFWTRAVGCPTCTQDYQLYYKTLNNGVWSSETKFTSDTNRNWLPAVAIGKDGLVRVAWSKGSPSTALYQIYYRTFNGVSWTPETQIVSSTYPDTRSSLAIDRDGTIWLFWTRRVPGGVADFVYVYSRYSTDGGSTWSAENNMTPNPPNKNYTNEMPAAVQSTSDNSIWVFYSTNLAQLGYFDIYALKSSAVSPIHDVAITRASVSTFFQYTGGLKSVSQSAIDNVNIIVSNLGDYSETVTVYATVSNTTSTNLGSKTGTIGPGVSLTFSFPWNTTGITPARYNVSGRVDPVPGESAINQADNSLSTKSAVWILPLGDIEQDGNVDILDVGVVYYNFGFSCGSPRYNPYADIDGTCTIDIISVGVVSKNYGIHI